MKQYLVIAELENKGYVIGTINDLKEAEDKSAELVILADEYPINELYKLNDHLCIYESYPINGNDQYCGKFKYCTSNGVFSVYVIEIDESFSIQLFISERSNTSYAAISEDDIIPEVLFYAN